jgi:hypothetical protein
MRVVQIELVLDSPAWLVLQLPVAIEVIYQVPLGVD